MSFVACLYKGLVGLAVALALWPCSAHAQGPLPVEAGAPFQVSSGAHESAEPAVAHNPNGHVFLVVWTKADGGIHARYVSEGGALTWSEFIVNGTFGARGGGFPAVAYNSATDEFLVVWNQSVAGPPPLRGIYAQRLAGNWEPPLGEFWVSATDYAAPAVAANTNPSYGDFYVVWGTGASIYAQRVGSSPMGPIRTVAAESSSPGHEIVYDHPRVAYDAGHNRFLTVFDRHDHLFFYTSDIYARMVEADGTLLPGPTVVDASPHDQRKPAVAASRLDPDNPFMVVYDDEYANPPDGDLTARLLDQDGAPVGGWLCVACSATRDETIPDIAGNDAFGYTIAWMETGGGATESVWGRRAGPGAVLQDDFIVSSWLGPVYPMVAVAGGAPLALVAWVDNLWGAGTLDVSARLLGFRAHLPVTRR